MSYKLKKRQALSRFACRIVVALFAFWGNVAAVEAQSLTDKITVECRNE